MSVSAAWMDKAQRRMGVGGGVKRRLPRIKPLLWVLSVADREVTLLPTRSPQTASLVQGLAQAT